MLVDLYWQEDNYLEQANSSVQDSYDEDVSTSHTTGTSEYLCLSTHRKH